METNIYIYIIICCKIKKFSILPNLLNAQLNPVCNLLSLLGAHHILHVSRIRVQQSFLCVLHDSRHKLQLLS